MTKPQRDMLFGLFGKLAKQRAWGPLQRDLQRDAVTVTLFGAARSWSTFDDGAVDKMKRRLKALLHTDSIAAQIADANAEEEGERARLLHRIESDAAKAGLGEGYLRTISIDFYDRAVWRALPIEQLENLRDTIAGRSRRKVAARKRDAAADPF